MPAGPIGSRSTISFERILCVRQARRKAAFYTLTRSGKDVVRAGFLRKAPHRR